MMYCEQKAKVGRMQCFRLFVSFMYFMWDLCQVAHTENRKSKVPARVQMFVF